MTDNRSSDHETLRIIDRALWVDHGDGNLDALTFELPIWADEWAERIVAAVNGQRVITDPAVLDTLPLGTIGRTDGFGGDSWTRVADDGWYTPLSGRAYLSSEVLARGAFTVLWTPENGDTDD